MPQGDVDLLEFPLNLEYMEAEFFLWGALGYGLDKVAPDLAMGGPAPVGVKKADLCPFVRDVVLQFAYQEVGHLKYVISLINLLSIITLKCDESFKKFTNIIDFVVFGPFI